MKPRSLRHSLEKAAKVLVTIQKHTPDVDCTHDELKGEHGHVILEFAAGTVVQAKAQALGRDLGGRAVTLERKSPWGAGDLYRQGR